MRLLHLRGVLRHSVFNRNGNRDGVTGCGVCSAVNSGCVRLSKDAGGCKIDLVITSTGIGSSTTGAGYRRAAVILNAGDAVGSSKCRANSRGNRERQRFVVLGSRASQERPDGENVTGNAEMRALGFYGAECNSVLNGRGKGDGVSADGIGSTRRAASVDLLKREIRSK